MATAIRVTGPALIGVGDFGQRTVSLLGAALPGAQVLPAGDLGPAFAREHRPVVVATWRPSHALCEQADELSFRYGRPWLPITMDSLAIRVGPLVSPSHGPCFRCFRRRREQHDRERDVTAALHAAYDADPGCGPGGHLPHQARTAAAVATSLLASGPGRVVAIRLRDLELTAAPVLGWHDCDRCGSVPVPDAGLKRLAAALPEANR